MSKEKCCFCYVETGRAGACDDSIFLGPAGPMCEGCYEEIKQDLDLPDLEAENARLRKVAEAARRYKDAGDEHAKQFSLRETDWNLTKLLRLEAAVGDAWDALRTALEGLSKQGG